MTKPISTFAERKEKYEKERKQNRAEGKLHKLHLTTRVPSKYRVIDLETGDVWVFKGGRSLPDGKQDLGWVRAEDCKVIVQDDKTIVEVCG